jgi:hypothetical protein
VEGDVWKLSSDLDLVNLEKMIRQKVQQQRTQVMTITESESSEKKSSNCERKMEFSMAEIEEKEKVICGDWKIPSKDI